MCMQIFQKRGWSPLHKFFRCIGVLVISDSGYPIMYQVSESLCNRTCDFCKFPHRVSADLTRLIDAAKDARVSRSASFILARFSSQLHGIT